MPCSPLAPADQPPCSAAAPLRSRVIATGGEAAEGYEWAIVSAGPPTRPSGTGCAGAIVSLLAGRGWLGARVLHRACVWRQWLAGLPANPCGLHFFVSARQPGVSGLWLFSREAQNPEALAQMMAKLEEMGVDTRHACSGARAWRVSCRCSPCSLEWAPMHDARPPMVLPQRADQGRPRGLPVRPGLSPALGIKP